MTRVFTILLLVFGVGFMSAAAQKPAVEIRPKNAMDQANAALRAGRPEVAAPLFDAVIANESKDAARYKADALFGSAVLHLSSEPALSDLPTARAALARLSAEFPTFARRYEVSAYRRLLADAEQAIQGHADLQRTADEQKRVSDQALAAKVAELAACHTLSTQSAAALDTLQKEVSSGKDDTSKLQREATTLRAENSKLKEELTKVQAELKKKDAALQKIVKSLVKPAS